MINKIDIEIIQNETDIFLMLDNLLEKRDKEWWDKFYSDRNKPIPFFINAPDENLVSYLKSGIFNSGKVLDMVVVMEETLYTLRNMDFKLMVLIFRKPQ